MITIEGLSRRQQAFADVLWNLETQDQVNDFIQSLPEQQRLECQTVLELIIAATMDEFMDYDVAADYLKRFQLN